ncbi:MAG: hypothetical protein WDA00_05015 [Eubacteriales bacterium]
MVFNIHSFVLPNMKKAGDCSHNHLSIGCLVVSDALPKNKKMRLSLTSQTNTEPASKNATLIDRFTSDVRHALIISNQLIKFELDAQSIMWPVATRGI